MPCIGKHGPLARVYKMEMNDGKNLFLVEEFQLNIKFYMHVDACFIYHWNFCVHLGVLWCVVAQQHQRDGSIGPSMHL